MKDFKPNTRSLVAEIDGKATNTDNQTTDNQTTSPPTTADDDTGTGRTEATHPKGKEVELQQMRIDRWAAAEPVSAGTWGRPQATLSSAIT